MEISSHSVDLLKPIGVFQSFIFVGSILSLLICLNLFYGPAKCICHSYQGFYFSNGHLLRTELDLFFKYFFQRLETLKLFLNA